MVALGNLIGNIIHHQGLQGWILAGVGMAAIDHDVDRHTGIRQLLLGKADTHRIVVGLAATAAQDYVGMSIAPGMNDGNLPAMIDAKKAMGCRH